MPNFLKPSFKFSENDFISALLPYWEKTWKSIDKFLVTDFDFDNNTFIISIRSFILFLSKRTFKTKALYLGVRKKPSCFAVSTLMGFLNHRFYTLHEKEAVVLKYSTQKVFWKMSCMSGPLSQKVWGCWFATLVRKYFIINFSELIFKTFQSNHHWLH